jgi:hypothetical protein
LITVVSMAAVVTRVAMVSVVTIVSIVVTIVEAVPNAIKHHLFPGPIVNRTIFMTYFQQDRLFFIHKSNHIRDKEFCSWCNYNQIL